jgi:hypothetical protein
MNAVTVAVKVSPATREFSSSVIVNPKGATGVTAALEVEGEPSPAMFSAFTRKIYSVPFDNPVTTADVEVEVESENGTHVVPVSDEYSIS